MLLGVFVVREFRSHEYSSHISPDGNFKVTVYSYLEFGFFPGQTGDASGYISLVDLNTNSELDQKEISMINTIDEIIWDSNAVSIGKLFKFNFTHSYAVKPAFKKGFLSYSLNRSIIEGDTTRFNSLKSQGATLFDKKLIENAVLYQDSAMVRFLLNNQDYRSYINSIPFNVMNSPYYLRNTEMITFLLDNGIDPKFKMRKGHYPLLIALQNSRISTVTLLLSRGVLEGCHDLSNKDLFNDLSSENQNIITHYMQSNTISCPALL